MGFTGNGSDGRLQESRPAGIVHEGEFVVSAPKVRAAGGAEKLNSLVEQEVGRTPSNDFVGSPGGDSTRQLPGFRRGGLVSSNVKRRAYEDGTGSHTAGAGATENDSGGFLTTPGDIGIPDSTINVQDQINDLGPATVHEGTDAEVRDVNLTDTSAVDNIDLSDSEQAKEFQALNTKTTGQISDIAAGRSDVSAVQSRIARQKQSATNFQSIAAAGQAAGQMGLLGGAQSTFLAKARRDALIASSHLEGQLAIDAVNRQENAIFALQGIAERGEAFEEAKRQWGANFDLAKANFGLEVEKFNEFKQQFADNFGLQIDQFNLDVAQTNELNRQWNETMEFNWKQLGENVRQFDAGVAVSLFQENNKMNIFKADTLLQLGDYAGYASFMKSQFGTDVDVSYLQEKKTEEQYRTAVADLALSIEGLNGESIFNEDGTVDKDSKAADDLLRMWNSSHEDQASLKDFDDPSSDFYKYAKTMFNNTQAKEDPNYHFLKGFTEVSKENFIFNMKDSAGNQVYKKSEDGKYLDAAGDEFEYNGYNGVEGIEMMLRDMNNGQGMMWGPDGELVPDPNHEIYRIFTGQMEPVTPKTKEEELDTRIDAFVEDPLKSWDDMKAADFTGENRTSNVERLNDAAKDSDAMFSQAEYSKLQTSNGGWADLDNMYPSEAHRRFIRENPIADPDNIGKIIVTSEGPVKIIGLETIGLSGDNSELHLMVERTDGSTYAIAKSARFEEPNTAEKAIDGTVDTLVDVGNAINPLNWSDKTVKENIVKIGSEKGFNIYEFNYTDEVKMPKGRYRGVIAQEVMKLNPEAVVKVEGKLAVKYDIIGIEFKKVA
jgi:hypothetical protein